MAGILGFAISSICIILFANSNHNKQSKEIKSDPELKYDQKEILNKVGKANEPFGKDAYSEFKNDDEKEEAIRKSTEYFRSPEYERFRKAVLFINYWKYREPGAISYSN